MGYIAGVIVAYVALFLSVVFVSSPDGQRLIDGLIDWFVELLGGGNGEA